jgi:putative ABC transport system ATP-binding protein
VSEAPIAVEGLNHWFGEGGLRRQVLFDVTAEIRAGEILIVTGPSGSGKTTFLTLIGALRSAQDGSVRVLGRELRGAGETALSAVRRRIGYVFQAHNLLDALTARQNVEMSLQLDAELAPAERVRRAREALDAVGLGERLDAHPGQLSGGQRQRVAIARALARTRASELADEPTASLDKETGRGVVEMLERLARRDGVTVVLVTHDNRILDVADRILALEDGRLASLMDAVTHDAGHLLRLLADDIRKGELGRRLAGLDAAGFSTLLDQVTGETRRLLALVDLVQGEAFEGALEQVARGFTDKAAELLGAERARLFFVDDTSGELWAHGRCEHGAAREERVPTGRGVLGRAVASGRLLRVPDGSREPRFDPAPDAPVAPAAGSLLAAPAADSTGRVFAVVELARSAGAPPFTAADEARLAGLVTSLALVLESWWRMSCSCRKGAVGRTPECCRS